MTRTLHDQLAAYGETEQSTRTAIGMTEIADRAAAVKPVPAPTPAQRPRARVGVMVGAFSVVVLLLASLPALLGLIQDDAPPVTEPPTTTIVDEDPEAPAPTTTVAPPVEGEAPSSLPEALLTSTALPVDDLPDILDAGWTVHSYTLPEGATAYWDVGMFADGTLYAYDSGFDPVSFREGNENGTRSPGFDPEETLWTSTNGGATWEAEALPFEGKWTTGWAGRGQWWGAGQGTLGIEAVGVGEDSFTGVRYERWVHDGVSLQLVPAPRLVVDDSTTGLPDGVDLALGWLVGQGDLVAGDVYWTYVDRMGTRREQRRLAVSWDSGETFRPVDVHRPEDVQGLSDGSDFSEGAVWEPPARTMVRVDDVIEVMAWNRNVESPTLPELEPTLWRSEDGKTWSAVGMPSGLPTMTEGNPDASDAFPRLAFIPLITTTPDGTYILIGSITSPQGDLERYVAGSVNGLEWHEIGSMPTDPNFPPLVQQIHTIGDWTVITVDGQTAVATLDWTAWYRLTADADEGFSWPERGPAWFMTGSKYFLPPAS